MSRARIFIASRFHEFGPLRDRLRRELPTEGFVVVDLNDGLASPRTTVERSLSELERCDAVVVLLGATYADETDPVTGLSVTELEWQRATELAKPVYCFAASPEQMDPAALAFYRRAVAIRSSTSGDLTGNQGDDCDVVLNSLLTSYGEMDDNADAETLHSALGSELNFLGARGLDSWTLSRAQTEHEPTYTTVVERRRNALRALERGNLTVARSHLESALETRTDDWAVNYTFGRLLELAGQVSDVDTIRACADIAADTAYDTEHAPMANETSLARRRAAALCLRGRAELRAGRADLALASSTEALAEAEFSRDALALAIEAAVTRNDIPAAIAAAERMLNLYPDRVVTLMRARALKDHGEIERQLIEHVVRTSKRAHAKVGRKPAAMTYERLRRALSDYRDFVTAERTRLAEAARNVSTKDEAQQFVAELETFNRAFCSFPNHGFRDYVPIGRSREGDLTRVSDEPVTSGGLVSSNPRIVRVVGGRDTLEVTDVGALTDLDEAIRIEKKIQALLAQPEPVAVVPVAVVPAAVVRASEPAPIVPASDVDLSGSLFDIGAPSPSACPAPPVEVARAAPEPVPAPTPVAPERVPSSRRYNRWLGRAAVVTVVVFLAWRLLVALGDAWAFNAGDAEEDFGYYLSAYHDTDRNLVWYLPEGSPDDADISCEDTPTGAIGCVAVLRYPKDETSYRVYARYHPHGWQFLPGDDDPPNSVENGAEADAEKTDEPVSVGSAQVARLAAYDVRDYITTHYYGSSARDADFTATCGRETVALKGVDKGDRPRERWRCDVQYTARNRQTYRWGIWYPLDDLSNWVKLTAGGKDVS